MPFINKIFVIGAFLSIVITDQALAEDPRLKGSTVVGTVKEEAKSWYAVVRMGRGQKKLYTKGDIFCSEVDINHCLRVFDIGKDILLLKDVGSKKIFTVKPGEKIPLKGSGIIFEKSVAADIIEYRYNDAPGTRKGLIEDFTVKGLEQGKLVVEKDYDRAYLPQGLTEEEKELFGSPRVEEEGPEMIRAGLFEQIEVKNTGQDSWEIDTEKADKALKNMGMSLFSVIRSVEPRYRFREGPSLKFNSELADVVINKEGFLIQNLAVGKIVERVGICKGDLIRSINGQPINSLYGIYKAYMNVKSDRDVRIVIVEIIRDGKPRTLIYKVR